MISLLSQAPEMTGAYTYARELIRGLGKRPRDVRVEVLCNEYGVPRLQGYVEATVALRQARDFRVGKSLSTRAAAMLSAAVLPGRLTRQLQSEPAVVHYPLTVGIPRVSWPTVLSLHDTQHLDLPEQWSAGGRAWRWLTYHRAARAATMVVTGSEYARKRIIELVGVRAERIVVIHYGVDHARFNPQPQPTDASLTARLGLPERFVYYPAGVWPHKNHRRLLEAFALLPDRQLGLVLTGASTGRLAGLLERARELGVAERVHFVGFVPDADLPALYRRARAVVFPSLYEGFGLPPLEAMACGCPVASSRRASLAEICADAAEVLEPEDPEQMARAITTVVDDEPRRGELRALGLARAARFSWEAVADAHVEVYRDAARLGR